jgi:hypothetical protein
MKTCNVSFDHRGSLYERLRSNLRTILDFYGVNVHGENHNEHRPHMKNEAIEFMVGWIYEVIEEYCVITRDEISDLLNSTVNTVLTHGIEHQNSIDCLLNLVSVVAESEVVCELWIREEPCEPDAELYHLINTTASEGHCVGESCFGVQF